MSQALTKIGDGEYHFKGHTITLAVHPKLFGKYEIHKGEEFIDRALDLADARSIINRTTKYGRHNPRNREDAFAYQFEEDVQTLKRIAMTGNPEDFQRSLQTLEGHIFVYRNPSKIKQHERASKNKRKVS